MYARLGGDFGESLLDSLLAMVSPPEIRFERIDAGRFDEAVKLRRCYRDKPKISFTDLTSMVVLQELGITEIVTADRHFEQVNLGFRLVPAKQADNFPRGGNFPPQSNHLDCDTIVRQVFRRRR